MKKTIMRILCLALMSCAAAVAQSTETVLYSFAGMPDGSYPSGGLLFDAAGNIYGTTTLGGTHCQGNAGCGTVYELSPALGGYIETVLYDFCTTDDPYTCPDGAQPWGGLVSDQAGNLYGTTSLGGHKYGTVFELSPPVGGGPWTETVLWEFGKAKGDGLGPYQGKLNWDAAGNLYGTTSAGGTKGRGTVFELSPISGGGWSETILYSFSGPDGATPYYGVAIDAAGNLYGTTNGGGIKDSNSYCQDGCGTVFELTHLATGWTEQLLYRPTGAEGARPNSNISIDSNGNLYGTLEYGGGAGCFAKAGCGGVFRLVPKAGGGGSKQTFLFDGQADHGGNPWAGVLVDGDVLFGTTYWGNNVYELKGKTETVLYQFCSQPNCADGSEPLAGTIVSEGGLLYGVTAQGGQANNGVVYSVTR
jgi:uncharacterized repeat protein (TIGR03803 family)